MLLDVGRKAVRGFGSFLHHYHRHQEEEELPLKRRNYHSDEFSSTPYRFRPTSRNKLSETPSIWHPLRIDGFRKLDVAMVLCLHDLPTKCQSPSLKSLSRTKRRSPASRVTILTPSSDSLSVLSPLDPGRTFARLDESVLLPLDDTRISLDEFSYWKQTRRD